MTALCMYGHERMGVSCLLFASIIKEKAHMEALQLELFYCSLAIRAYGGGL